VLQNLTVVPILGEYSHEPLGSYRAVIGHRRLAAAKLAGLETVPCIVANMTEHEQLKTMIMENMQRADLTLIEQAGAFQMMMDLGDSINSIALVKAP
jgi:ParB family chromosome partitioning protein